MRIPAFVLLPWLLGGCGFGLELTKGTESSADSAALGRESGRPPPDEDCDGVDNNGDGRVDEGYDRDGDHFTSCGDDDTPADCDDEDPYVYPGAEEQLGNDVDDDCDGSVDNRAWAAGELLVTEVLYDPLATGEPTGEWFELYNASSGTIDVAGVLVELGNGASFALGNGSSLPVPAGTSFVVASNGDSGSNGGVSPDYVYGGVELLDAGDSITLSAGGVIIDEVAWDASAGASGASYMVDPEHYGEDNARFWCVATRAWSGGGDKGSPGEINEPCTTLDHDGDGFTANDGDCDDTDAAVYPGAPSPDSSVDWDCDGVLNGTPTAVATLSGNAYTCDALQLDGSGSSDPDGDRLAFDWSLVSAPFGSAATTSSIVTTTSARPTMYADAAGTYRFSLTVHDGTEPSTPSSLSVDVTTRPTNETPSADAGSDQSASLSAACTPINYGLSGYDCDPCASSSFSLSALGSRDGDGDTLTYAWSIVSGGLFGTLSTTSGSSTTLTISNVIATNGSATIQDVVVQVLVTDCMGATATDTVTLRQSCTGT